MQIGFIRLKTVIVIIIVLVVFGLLGISVRDDIVENEQVGENVSYVWQITVAVYDNYIKEPLTWFWEEVFVDLIWGAFVGTMNALKDGEDIPATQYAPAPNYQLE
jgi:amino acid permease